MAPLSSTHRKLSTKGGFMGTGLGSSLALCNPSKAIALSAKQYHCTTLTATQSYRGNLLNYWEEARGRIIRKVWEKGPGTTNKTSRNKQTPIPV